MTRPNAPPCGTDRRFSLPGTPEAVRATLTESAAFLADKGLAPASLAIVEIVLAEALNNIVEHACPGTGEDAIVLHLGVSRDKLCLCLEDCGAAMPGGDLPDPGPANLDVPRDDLPEGGFGWFLIQSLASELQYRRRDGRNKLKIGMSLAREA